MISPNTFSGRLRWKILTGKGESWEYSLISWIPMLPNHWILLWFPCVSTDFSDFGGFRCVPLTFCWLSGHRQIGNSLLTGGGLTGTIWDDPKPFGPETISVERKTISVEIQLKWFLPNWTEMVFLAWEAQMVFSQRWIIFSQLEMVFSQLNWNGFLPEEAQMVFAENHFGRKPFQVGGKPFLVERKPFQMVSGARSAPENCISKYKGNEGNEDFQLTPSKC